MKKIKYVVLVVIGILAFHQPIFAEKNIERTKIEPSSRKYNTIQGVAISSIDKKPIPFATVCIEGTTFGCLTDEFGRFQFKSPSKKIKLVASCIGYEDYKKEIIFTRKQVFNIDIELIPAIVMLDEIIVKGASKGQLNKEKGYSMGLVDTENAKLQTIESIDLLNRASGVILRQSGGVGSNVQFNINGLTGNSVRIFIDGIPIRNFGSSFSLSSIPPSMIERIEVYKGVIPATLSEDALGGAINVILKQSSQDNLSTSYSYGSFNTHKWDMNGNYHNDENGFTVGGSAFFNHSDNSYKVWGDDITLTDEDFVMHKIVAERFHDAYTSAGINVSAGFRNVKWADKFLVGALYSKMKKEIQHGASPKIVYGNRHSRQETKMVNVRYDKTNIINKLDASLFTSFSNGNRQVIDTIPYMYNWQGEIMKKKESVDGQLVDVPRMWGNGNGGEGSERKTDAMNVENNLAGRYRINYRFIPNHSISANMLYNRFTRDVEDSFIPQIEKDLMDTHYLTKNIYSFASENRLFDSKLNASLFYKIYKQTVELSDPTYDRYDEEITVNHVSRSTLDHGYGCAVSYKLRPSLRLNLSAEKAIRLPESSELLGNTTENIQTTYDLRPEKSINVNVGVFGEPVDNERHYFNYDVNIFYRDVTDMIQRALARPDDQTYGYENIGKVLSKGVDVDFNYNFNKKLFVNTTFSYLDARFNLQHDEYGIEYIQYNNRLRNMPYLTFNINAMWKKESLFQEGSMFSVNYNLGYVHKFFLNWESLGSKGKAFIPTKLVHDAGFVYTFPEKKISLGFDVRNILNEQVFDNWALQKAGRAFFMKLTYNIM